LRSTCSPRCPLISSSWLPARCLNKQKKKIVSTAVSSRGRKK
jgi:hypothetical protein